jgi:hypothetical protein
LQRKPLKHAGHDLQPIVIVERLKKLQIVHCYDHSFPLRYKAQKGTKPRCL